MAKRPSFGDHHMKRLLAPTVLLGIFAVAEMPQAVHAGNIYKFRDADGNILFTNVVTDRKKPRGDDFKKYTVLEKVTWFKDTNVHKYSNWGADEFAVRPSFSKNRNAFDNIIQTAAASHNVDHGLIKAIIHTESGFNPNARSKPGAQGLMQLMPATAGMYGVNDAYNPDENIKAGTKHIKYLIERYHDIELALAAYNAGEGNVKKYGGIPPFAETQDYVKRVLSRYRNLYGGSATAIAALSPAVSHAVTSH